jgi:CRP/FNR family cyclic AMP-dependent transcriptional regulator
MTAGSGREGGYDRANATEPAQRSRVSMSSEPGCNELVRDQGRGHGLAADASVLRVCGFKGRCGELSPNPCILRTMPPTVAEELSALEIFAGVDVENLTQLGRHALVRRLVGGQLLFVAGDPGDHLVLVRSGRLRVLVTSERGQELVLTILGPGEALGELSIVDGLPRSASVEAVEAVELVLLPADRVRGVLLGDPAATLAAMRMLAGQVRRLTGSAADLVFLDLGHRLAKLVVARAGSDSVADLGVSQSGLAAQLGATRQSVNRALAGLQRRGWVDVEGSRVLVRDAAALRRFSGS